MKKITKLSAISLLALTAMGLPLATNAKMVDADYIKELSKVVDGSEVIGYNNVYFFGKYAFVNSLTTADLVKAANTLEGATDAVLYLKDTNNTWKNAVDTSKTFKASDLSFNLVKIFNVDSTVATDAAKADDVEKENATTLVFEDEAATVKVSKVSLIKAVDSIGDNQGVATASQNYNISSLDVSMTGSTIKVNETSPLISYQTASHRVTKSAGKWYGLVFKMNKAFDASKIEFNVATDDKMNAAAVKEAETYGTGNNEFVVWLNADGLTQATTTKYAVELIEHLDSSNTNTEKYTIEYTTVNKLAEVTETEKHNIVTTGDLKVSEVKLSDNSYKYVYYTEKATTAEKYEFTDDGYTKSIATSNGIITDVLEYKDIKVTKFDADKATKKTNAYDWNQSAATVDVAKKDIKTDNVDYEVTVTYTKVLQGTDGIALDVDLSVPANIAVGSVAGTNVVLSATTKVNVKGNDVVTFTKDNNKIVIKFVLKDAIPAVKVTAATKVASSVKLYPNATEGSAQETINTNFQTLSNALYNAELTKTSDTAYSVSLYAKNALSTSAVQYAPGFTGLTDSKYWIPVIVNVDNTKVSDLTITPTNAVVFNKEVSLYGAAEGTEFVAWVEPTNAGTITIKNNNTEKETTLTIKVFDKTATQTVFATVDGTENTAELVDPVVSKPGVRLDTTGDVKQFRIFDASIKNFVVTDGTTEYTFYTEGSDWSAPAKNHVLKSLKLVSYNQLVDSTKATSDAGLKYNLASLVAVEKDEDSAADKLIVKYNRVMGNTTAAVATAAASKDYGLLLNLGAKAYKDANGTANLELVSTPESKAKIANIAETRAFLGITDATVVPDYTLVWVNEAATSLKFQYKTEDTFKVYIDVALELKKVANDEDMAIKTVNAADVSSLDYTATTDRNYALITNANAIKSTTIDANNTIILTSKMALDNFKKTDTTPADKYYIPVVVDLGVAPFKADGETSNITLVSTDAVLEPDAAVAKKLAGSNYTTTTFVIYVDKDAAAGAGVTAVLSNHSDNNQNDKITLTFKLKEDLTKLALNSVEFISSDVKALSAAYASYKVNQDLFIKDYKAEYVATEKAVKYTSTSEGLVAYTNATPTIGSGKWVAMKLDFGKEVTAKYVDTAANVNTYLGGGATPAANTATTVLAITDTVDDSTASKFGATDTELIFLVNIDAVKGKVVVFEDEYTKTVATLAFTDLNV